MAANASPRSQPSYPSSAVDISEWGRRLTAEQIAEEFYSDNVSVDWVNDHVAYRERVSHRVVLWWEFDVRAHLREERVRVARGEPAYNRRARGSSQ